MAKLFKESMVPEVFAWTAVSNNQALIAGKASYILIVNINVGINFTAHRIINYLFRIIFVNCIEFNPVLPAVFNSLFQLPACPEGP